MSVKVSEDEWKGKEVRESKWKGRKVWGKRVKVTGENQCK